MIIDNVIPKGYSLVNSLIEVVSADVIRKLHSRQLQTVSMHLYKHDKFDSYVFVRIAFYAVHIQDFDCKNDLIDYLEYLAEDAII